MLREEWETIPKVILFSFLWVSTMSIVVLTLSSPTPFGRPLFLVVSAEPTDTASESGDAISLSTHTKS